MDYTIRQEEVDGYAGKVKVEVRYSDAFGNCKYLSDFFTEEDVSNFSSHDAVFIKAETGMGKSTFARTMISEDALRDNKEVLFLIHRIPGKRDIEDEIQKDLRNNMVVSTYQKIRYDYDNDELDYLDGFKYIICDESHAFITDSEMNPKMNSTLDLLLRSNSTCIFMSATPTGIEEYVNMYYKELKMWNIKISMDTCIFDRNMINDAYMYYDKESMIKAIEGVLESGEKAFIMLDRMDQVLDLYDRFKSHALFSCSRTREEYKYVDEDAIDYLISTNKLPKKLLISTSTMAEAISFKDEDLKHIFIESSSPFLVKQAIGRKRPIDEDDTYNVHLMNINLRRLVARKRVLEERLDASILFDNDPERFLRREGEVLGRFNNLFMAYTEGENKLVKINKAVDFYNKIRYKELEEMLTYDKASKSYQNDFDTYMYSKIGFDDIRINKDSSRTFKRVKTIKKLTREKKIEKFILENLHREFYSTDGGKQEILDIINESAKVKVNSLKKVNDTLDELFKGKYTIKNLRNKSRNKTDSLGNDLRGKRYWKFSIEN